MSQHLMRVEQVYSSRCDDELLQNIRPISFFFDQNVLCTGMKMFIFIIFHFIRKILHAAALEHKTGAIS